MQYGYNNVVDVVDLVELVDTMNCKLYFPLFYCMVTCDLSGVRVCLFGLSD